jgi:hypothetical protein
MDVRKWFLSIPLLIVAFAQLSFAEVVGVQPGSGNFSPFIPAPFAAGATPVNSSNISMAETDPNYVRCGPACLYNKSNENISLRIEHLKKKLEFLNDPNVTSSQKRSVLGGFCAEVAGMKEDIDDCLDRYKKVQALWFIKARGALGINNGNIHKLSCAQSDQNGNCLISQAPVVPKTQQSVEQEAKKMAQVPYFIKSLDMAKQAMQSNAFLSNVRDTEEWEDSITGSIAEIGGRSFEPSKDDFVKFKLIDRDPSNPGAGQIEVPSYRPDGSLDYDEMAYNRAHQAWNTVFKEAVKVSTLGRDMSKVAQQEKAKFLQDFSADSQGPKSDSRAIYDNARGEYVEFINQAFSPSSQVTFPGSQVSKSSQNGIVVPAGNYTGNEMVKPHPANPDSSQKTTSSYSVIYEPSQVQIRSEPVTPGVRSRPKSAKQSQDINVDIDSTQGLIDVLLPN